MSAPLFQIGSAIAAYTVAYLVLGPSVHVFAVVFLARMGGIMAEKARRTA